MNPVKAWRLNAAGAMVAAFGLWNDHCIGFPAMRLLPMLRIFPYLYALIAASSCLNTTALDLNNNSPTVEGDGGRESETDAQLGARADVKLVATDDGGLGRRDLVPGSRPDVRADVAPVASCAAASTALGPLAPQGRPVANQMRDALVMADRLRVASSSGQWETAVGAALTVSVAGLNAVTPAAMAVKAAAGASPVSLLPEFGFGVFPAKRTPGGTAAAGGAGGSVPGAGSPTLTMNCTASGCRFDGYTMGDISFSGCIGIADRTRDEIHIVWAITLATSSSNPSSPMDLTYALTGDIVASPSLVAGEAGLVLTGTVVSNGTPVTIVLGSYIRFEQAALVQSVPRGGSVFAKMWYRTNATPAVAYQAGYDFP